MSSAAAPALDVAQSEGAGGEVPVALEESAQLSAAGEEAADQTAIVADEVPAEEPAEEEVEEEESRAVGVTLTRSTVEAADNLAVPDQPITVDNRYLVYPARPLPELDSPSARAYEAVDRQEPGITIMALVPIPGMPLRKKEIEETAGVPIPGVVTLHDAGIADWPHFGRQAPVLFFERPMGGRVVSVLKSDIQDFRKVDIVRAMVESALTALRHLSSRNFVHHAIRPDNMFFVDEDQTEVVLGEFVSAPPSFDQPVAFETIERAMAAPAGRGVGTFSDDLYSFGATLAFLVQDANPVRGMTKEDLILAKIIHSSYQTLVGRHVLTARFLELMRGLLHDDPLQRWDYDAIDQWQNGRRVPASQSTLSVRSQRPFRFGNVDHIQPRSLAYVMSQRRESAVRLIRDGSLETWIQRGLDDKDLASSVRGRIEFSDAIKDAHDPDDMLLTRVLLALDRLAPVSYKSISFFPNGIGAMLAVEILRDGDVRTIAEALQRDIPQLWFEAQIGGMAHHFQDQTSIQRLRLHLHKTAPGYGIERLLYETNPSLPCKSPLLGTAHVSEIEELLPVLNDAERQVDSKQKPLDRHLAAFIAARAGSDMEGSIDAFSSRDEAVSSMAVLGLYSQLQAKYGPEMLLGLSRWIGGQVGPIIRLYHSRATRRDLENEIPSIVRRGSLPELLALLDNPELRNTDQAGFGSAVSEFQKAEEEIVRIQTTSKPSSDHVQRTARQVAAVISICLMVCVVSIIIMTR